MLNWVYLFGWYNKRFLDITNIEHADNNEKEADSFAQEKLISQTCWNDLLNNYINLKI